MNNLEYSIKEGTSPQWDEVAKGIIEFNQKQTGLTLVPPQKATRVAFDENGKVIGGILCNYIDIMDNLFVDILWVDEKYRGKGIGSALLSSVEDFARERNCILVHLETLDFQAKDFYLKQGYSVFGTLEGPPGHERYFMNKNVGAHYVSEYASD
jgi:GNAT superfamily N-acetyltransferase